MPRSTAHGPQVVSFIGAVVDFIIFMAVIYFLIVVPYRAYSRKRGQNVFREPAPTKTCPNCKSTDLPVDATKCLHCASELAVTA